MITGVRSLRTLLSFMSSDVTIDAATIIYMHSTFTNWHLVSGSLSGFKCSSSFPSFPLHSQPSFLYEHHTSRSLRDLSKARSRMNEKLGSLQSAHGLLALSNRCIHSLQNLCPQQLMRQGSFRIRRQIGHSVWNVLGGGSTNSQLYPLSFLSRRTILGRSWAGRGSFVAAVIFF